MAELHEIRAQATRRAEREGDGGAARQGKLTARERIELLLDPGSFREVEQLRRHRATGFGLEAKSRTPTVSSPAGARWRAATVFVYAHDFRIFGGALARLTPRRSTRSWTWPSRPVPRWSP
ncbi:hypothetical protein LV779_36985 [Streptomyces thinghirensis]|nr:hypothetical protein [Streptomyces thinghirensis]